MNTRRGGCIDRLETERGNALEGQRARREHRAVKAAKARMEASSSSKGARPVPAALTQGNPEPAPPSRCLSHYRV